MIDTIRLVVQNILNHWDLTDYSAGTVMSTAPLRIRVNERLVLEPVNLIAACDMATLAVGDKVVLLKVMRGQKYIILAKAVSLDE